MTAYRISRWVDLSGQFDQLRFRKTLMAMSVGVVDQQWMAREGGLGPQEQHALLRQLHSEGVLVEVPIPTLDSSAESFFETPPRRTSAGLMAQVGRWLLAGGIAVRSGHRARS